MAAATPQPRKLELDPKYDDYDFPYEAPVPQNGHPGFTTPEQDAQVAQLRMHLESAGIKDRLDTLTMLRFLRARKFNVEAAKQMFLNDVKWRNEFGGGVDKMVPGWDYPEKTKMFDYYPQYYHKTDKDGRPVYIEELGKIDLTAMRKITTDERMLQNLVVEYEKMVDPRLPACSRKSGHLTETCTSLFDLKGVGLGKAGQVYGYLQQASGVSQDHYPERLGKLYVINAPWGFSSVFAFVKKFLDPVTVSKIHILGGGYKDELMAQIPKENLPTKFGGTCECPGGCQFSDQGPWREEQYYRPAKWEKVKAGQPAEENAIQSEAVEGQAGQPASAEVVPGQNAQPAQAGAADATAGQPVAPPAGATASAGAPAPAPAAQ